MALRFTRKARQDILDIWLGVAASSIRVADRINAQIERSCRRLLDFPEEGPRRTDIGPDVRIILIQRWIIVYRPIPGGVQIVRIVDGARDLTRLKLPDE